jgi:hypothetical protein
MPTQAEIAEHLDMSERNVRDVLKGLADKYNLDSDWWKNIPLGSIRTRYIRDLREKAAGRGGDDQFNLTKQRAEESRVKTAMMNLEYHEKLGLLVQAEVAAAMLIEWAMRTNREVQSGFTKLAGEIQSTHKIEVSNKLVEDIAGPTLKRIQEHAADIGRNLVESSGGVQTSGDVTNS